MNKSLKFLGLAFVIYSAGFLSAMEEGANRGAGSIIPFGAAPKYVSGLDVTDTELVIRGMHEGNMREYFSFVKAQVREKMSAFIDTLLAYNGAFLDGGVHVGGRDQPVNTGRDAFKSALEACVDHMYLITPIPANLKISSLVAFESSVYVEVINGLDAYLRSLLADNGKFLDAGVAIGGLNQPVTNTRDEFMYSLGAAIAR